MSFVGHRSRAFRDAGDLPLVVPKRSEGRIKAYPSATDARAWCVDTEERRQHILDLIRADHEKCALGKYIPMEVLIDTLLANKNADIARLRAQVDELQSLLDMYSKLDLTEDQKRMLEGMKREMAKAGVGLGGLGARRLGDSDGETDTEFRAGTESGTDGETSSTFRSTKKPADTRSTCSAVSRTNAEKAAKAAAAGSAAAGPGGVIEKDAEIIALKNALAAKEAELEQQNKIARAAIEQLETLKNIVEERDTLKKRLEDSLHEIKTLKSRIEDPCVKEIAALEAEIERLRTKGQLSPAEETEIIRKEVEVLKKYCAKLSSIQEENNRLKTQVDRLRELSGIPSNFEEEEESNDPNELKKKLKELKRKLAKLNEIMEERDRHKRRVQQLEKELRNYGALPEEIEVFRQRSQMLDDIMDERDNLQERLARLKGLEEEVAELKKKADRVDELEKLLNSMNKEMGVVRKSSVAESQAFKLQRDESAKELENLKAERDVLKRKSADMASVEEDNERLRYRAKEAEVLRIERDRMKVKLDELAAMESEYMKLLDKTRGMDALKAERDMYKQKYEELLGLECECDMLKNQVEKYKQLDQERDSLVRQVRECECCIADQEDEIKKLVNHIDRISQGSNQQQDRMQKALCDVRAELEQKTCLIATSEEQLAGVQDQLKTTIAEVSCETSCLRARIEELEIELEEANFKLKERENEVVAIKESLTDKDDLIRSLSSEHQAVHRKSEKGASFGGDEHLKQMLTESKCAVRKVAEELGKHYEEWDCMQGRLLGEDQDLFTKYTEEKRNSLKLSNDVDELQQKIRELEEELAKANDTIAKLREGAGVTDRLSAENQALRRHSTEVQDVAKEQIEELVGHLKSAKDRIAELEAQNAALMKRAPTADAGVDNCDELKQQLEDMQLEKNKLQTLVQQFQQDQESGAPDVGALRMDLANLQEQLEKETKLRQAAEEKLQAAEERIVNLTKQLDSLTDSIQDKVRKSSIAETELEAELLKLRAENEQLRENMKNMGDSATRRTSQVEGEMSVIAEQNKELLKEKIGLESENASLKQQLADLKQQLENLKAGAGDTSELDAMRKANEALQTQITEQKTEINNLVEKMNVPTLDVSTDANKEQLEKERKEKEELQNLIKNLQNQISAMEKVEPPPAPAPVDNSALNEAIAKLTKQLEGEQAKATACEDALRKLQQENAGPPPGDDAALLNEIAVLKKKVGGLEEENAQLKTTSSSGNEKIKSLEDEISRLKSSSSGDSAALNDEISKLNAKVKQLEDENAQLKSSASGDTAALNDAIAKLNARVQQLEEENSQLKSSASGDTAALNDAIAKLNAKVQQLEGENSQLKSSASGDTAALNDAIAKLNEKVKQLEEENSQLKSSASGDTAALNAEMAKLRETVKSLEADNERLKASASGDMSALTDEIAKLQAQVKKTEEDNAQLKSSATGADTSALTEQIAQLKAKISELEGENDMLKNKINDLEKENTELAAAAAGDDTVLFSQLSNLKLKIKELEMENMDLKGKLSRMQSQISGIAGKEMESDHLFEIKSVSKSFEDKLKQSSQSIKMLENSMNLSKEDQAILQKMKDAYEDQIKALQNELELQKKQCADTVASLRAQYDRDIKNINNKYNDGIAKLQGSHEEILKDVGKEYEQEVENLRSELRKSKEEINAMQKGDHSKTSTASGPGKGSLSIKTVENVSISTTADSFTKSPGRKGICTCGNAALEKILHKILKYGIEALSYEDLRMLHDKTRDATTALLRKSSASSGAPAAVSHPRSASVDSQGGPILKKMSSGSQEGDMMRKQKHAQQKVGALQVAVKMERERLEELKKDLEMEKQRNNELMLKLGAQTRTVSSLQNERDSFRRQSTCNEEKVQELARHIEKERQRVKKLEHDLQKTREQQKRDSEALEVMRVKLEKSLTNELTMKKELDQHSQRGSSQRGSKSFNIPPCTCAQASGTSKPHQDKIEFETRSSFYTELTIQDVKNKRNFMHHCCSKRSDHPSTSSDRGKDCPIKSPPPRKPEHDD